LGDCAEATPRFLMGILATVRMILRAVWNEVSEREFKSALTASWCNNL